MLSLLFPAKLMDPPSALISIGASDTIDSWRRRKFVEKTKERRKKKTG